MTRTALLLLLPAMAGCPIGNNKYPKPADLPSFWRIDRLRVLAIRADPPEIAPGETSRFEALVVDGTGERPPLDEVVTFWLTCTFEQASDTAFGCFGTQDAAPSLFPPVVTPAPDALDGLDDATRQAGIYTLGQVFALPADLAEDLLAGLGDPMAAEGVQDLDPSAFNDVESGFKRLVVSEEATPNRNPGIAGFTFDGAPVPPGAVVEVDLDQRYEVGIVLEDDASEVYTYVNRDGVEETRFEEPWARWHATGGTVLEEITLFGYLQSDWAAPTSDDDEAPSEGSWWVVVRDRRGGISWAQQRWRVRTP